MLRITAKCVDLFSASLYDAEGREVGTDYDGYVPSFMPAHDVSHFGDYVELDIDLATGQIKNWKKPTKKQLREVFKDA